MDERGDDFIQLFLKFGVEWDVCFLCISLQVTRYGSLLCLISFYSESPYVFTGLGMALNGRAFVRRFFAQMGAAWALVHERTGDLQDPRIR